HTPPTDPSTLSLHDALPIFHRKHALVDPDDLVEERNAVGQARAGRADRAAREVAVEDALGLAEPHHDRLLGFRNNREAGRQQEQDRKSTRLNSSHVAISYAV